MMCEKFIGANKNFLLSPSAEKIQFMSPKFHPQKLDFQTLNVNRAKNIEGRELRLWYML